MLANKECDGPFDSKLLRALSKWVGTQGMNCSPTTDFYYTGIIRFLFFSLCGLKFIYIGLSPHFKTVDQFGSAVPSNLTAVRSVQLVETGDACTVTLFGLYALGPRLDFFFF